MAKHADCNSVLYCIVGYLQELATLNDSLQSSLGAHVTCKAALVRIQPSPPRLTLEDKSAGEVNVTRQSCLLLMVNLLILYARNGRSEFDSHHGRREAYTVSSFVQSVVV